MIASITLGVTANYPRTTLVSIPLVAKGMIAQASNFRKKLKVVPYPNANIATERRRRSKGHN